MFKSGYILNAPADYFWFVGLPFLAIGVALACQAWLTAVVIASAGLWLTLPHHLATWVRCYGIEDEFEYYKGRLIVGPIIIVGMTVLGLAYAPLTLLLVVTLWDHQHSLMQQHGFARIYDFKAGTGGPDIGKLDLTLAWMLYTNLFLTTPFFTNYWVRELYRFQIPISLATVNAIHYLSYAATGAYFIYYLYQLNVAVKAGHKLNPVKYLFIGSSYFLWYFTAWHTNDFLVYTIAHRIMHGLQYIVIVHWYIWNKQERAGGELKKNFLTSLLRPGSVLAFVGLAIVYAVVFQLISGRPLEDFGFGVTTIAEAYNQPVEEMGMSAMTSEASYAVYAVLLIYSVQLVHYYFDSFIWKVREKKVQSAL